MSASRKIAEFAAGVSATDLTPSLLNACGRAFLDTYAVALAGRNEEASQLAVKYIRAGETSSPRFSASLWGCRDQAPLELAALCNGVSAHVLDYDDVTSPMRGHPSVALLPALVALGESLNANGSDLARAYLVGFEVICKLSRAMAVKHYAKGWHSTSAIGTVACAVACATMMRLDVEQIIHAIGLAVAQTAGTQANFGTHAKSFQAGHCNASGLRAVLLAREGFCASEGALDGQFGYMDLYAHGESLQEHLDALGNAPFELEQSGIEVKKYPLCYATHRALDGLLDLRAEHQLSLDQVREVHIRTSAGALTPLIHHRPVTGLEGKFSLEYAVAAALADGHIGLASFTDEAVKRPAVQAFFPKVFGSEASDTVVFPRWTEICIELHDNSTLFRRVAVLRGSAQAPLSEQALRVKVADCLAWSQSPLQAARLCDMALDLGHTTVRSLLAAPHHP